MQARLWSIWITVTFLPPLQQGCLTPMPSGHSNPQGSLPLWVRPVPSAGGRAEIVPVPIQPGPPEPWKTSQGDTGLCCGPSSSSEVVVVAVASFARAFLAQRTDRGRLTLEKPRESWHCCPPRKSGGTGNSRAAAWQPVPRASPQPRVFLLLNPGESRVSRTGLLFRTAREKGAGSLFIEFPEPRETPLFCSFFPPFCFSKRHPLALHLKLRSLKKLRANPGQFPPTIYW